MGRWRTGRDSNPDRARLQLAAWTRHAGPDVVDGHPFATRTGNAPVSPRRQRGRATWRVTGPGSRGALGWATELEPAKTACTARRLDASASPTVLRGGLEPPSPGYRPDALPLSYRRVAHRVGVEPTRVRFGNGAVPSTRDANETTGATRRTRTLAISVRNAASLPRGRRQSSIPILLSKRGSRRTRTIQRTLYRRGFSLDYPQHASSRRRNAETQKRRRGLPGRPRRSANQPT